MSWDVKILLVDDHPMVRTGVRATLQHHLPSATLYEADCAADACAVARSASPQIVLMDVHLPGTNGLDLVRTLRVRHRRIKVLMVAADTDPWTVGEALDAGAMGFLSKAASGDLLPAAIRTVLSGGVFLCPDSQLALRRYEERGDAFREAPAPAVLSVREREILCYLANGENTKNIAALLNISPKTVETHRMNITRKLGTNSVAALVRYSIRHGLARA